MKVWLIGSGVFLMGLLFCAVGWLMFVKPAKYAELYNGLSESSPFPWTISPKKASRWHERLGGLLLFLGGVMFMAVSVYIVTARL